MLLHIPIPNEVFPNGPIARVIRRLRLLRRCLSSLMPTRELVCLALQLFLLLVNSLPRIYNCPPRTLIYCISCVSLDIKVNALLTKGFSLARSCQGQSSPRNTMPERGCYDRQEHLECSPLTLSTARSLYGSQFLRSSI